MRPIKPLDLGLTFAKIPVKTFGNWSRLILRSVFLADGWPTNRVTALSIDAFSDLTDTPMPLERYWGNRLMELLYELNAPETHAGASTRARLSALTDIPQGV